METTTKQQRSRRARFARRLLAATVLVSALAVPIAASDAVARDEKPAEDTKAVLLDVPDRPDVYSSDQPASAELLVVEQVGFAAGIDELGGTVRPTDGPITAALDFQQDGEGCALGCILRAETFETADPTVTLVEVDTSVPALVDLWITEAEPPAFWLPAAADITASSGDYLLATALDLNDLEPGETYWLTVRATDFDGNQSYLTGPFQAEEAADVLITIESIEVLHDADTNNGNAGELAFFWGFGNTIAGSFPEQDLHSGAVVYPDNGNTLLITEAVGNLPGARVQVNEHDPNDDGSSCEASSSNSFQSEFTGSVPCHNTQWNTAFNGIQSLATIEAMPLCTAAQVAAPAPNLYCDEFQTFNHGGEIPGIKVVASYLITP